MCYKFLGFLYFNLKTMKCPVCTPAMRDFGLFVLRLSVGVVFIYHGWMKLTDIEGTTAFFGSQGFPIAGALAYLVGLVEFVGGVAVVLGVFTKVAALFLAVVMVVALLTV